MPVVDSATWLAVGRRNRDSSEEQTVSSLSPERRYWRSRIANLSKPEVHASPGQLEEAQRQYKAASMEQYIRELVDSAPPLSAEQRARLAGILAPAAGNQS